jgi:hypothetical protein
MEALFIDRLINKEDDLHKMPCLLRRSVSFMVPEMGWDAMVGMIHNVRERFS